jgi:ParB-like chromosome segregation protein Spo0J
MENKIIKQELVDWKSLKPFQPADLKKQTKGQLEKIKESFKNNGFKSPFLVWEEKENIWVLDGHTRIPALKLLEDEGVIIPVKLKPE